MQSRSNFKSVCGFLDVFCFQAKVLSSYSALCMISNILIFSSSVTICQTFSTELDIYFTSENLHQLIISNKIFIDQSGCGW